MTRAMIWRDSQMPHARSGGITPLTGRNVYALTAAAPRERNEPRAGTTSVMHRSQSQMVTFVNGMFGQTLGGSVTPACAVRVLPGTPRVAATTGLIGTK
jgi:hypothetical protein